MDEALIELHGYLLFSTLSGRSKNAAIQFVDPNDYQNCGYDPLEDAVARQWRETPATQHQCHQATPKVRRTIKILVYPQCSAAFLLTFHSSTND